jgi:tetratricopeptide (TPR) repeat protein
MPERALIYFNKLLRRDCKNIDVLINKGYSLHLMGKYRNAIICYNKVLKQDPKEMNAIYYKSKSTAKQNDERQTCDLVSKLLKFDSSHDHDHDHDHNHDHMDFLEKIQKDSDFKKMKKNANFLLMLKHN